MKWLDRLRWWVARLLDDALWGWGRSTLLDRALWGTFLVALGIAVLGDEGGLRTTSVAVGSAQAQIGIALMGVVLAGLAILIAFLDEEYILLLEELAPGAEADLFPFLHTAVVAAFSATTGVALILIGSPSDATILRIFFFFATWSFLYLIWIMLDLTRFVTGHLRARIRQIKAKSRASGEQERQKQTGAQ